MDPITQGTFGALWAQAGGRGKRKVAAVAGALAGMAPDLDVLIRSSEDALLALDFHRHFTHAIPFAPVGGGIVALLLYPLLKRHIGFAQLYIVCLLGYLSHGILDTFTSYGTSLGWPLTDHRAALNWISVIDPLFTLPLIALLLTGLKRPRFIAAAALWALAYLSLGGWQHQRAEQTLLQWAERTGLPVERHITKPSFANLLLWRGLVDSGGTFHNVAIYLPPGSARLTPGAQVAQITADDIAPSGTTLHRDVERFAHFSDDWLFRYKFAESPDDWFLGDFRYAIDPASARPLWGIRFEPDQRDSGVAFERLPTADRAERERYWQRLQGKSPPP
ncbi:metal-dependent hydrolase [Litorivivens sp.]|uniref:metal-dependent hydrolase n=1 Tax=Litorivivens sp. TaxID=2020868 RepID=UPI0035643C87